MLDLPKPGQAQPRVFSHRHRQVASLDQLPMLPACASDQLVRSFSTKPISDGEGCATGSPPSSYSRPGGCATRGHNPGAQQCVKHGQTQELDARRRRSMFLSLVYRRTTGTPAKDS